MRTVFIDGNSLLWRSMHGFGVQNTAQGVITHLNTLLPELQPTSLVVCWDIGKSRWRTAVHPEYKANRKKAKEDVDRETLEEQWDALKRYFKAMGIQQVAVNGIEADDLLSWLSEYRALSSSDDVVLVTIDRDLWQLISPRVRVYDHVRCLFITADVAKERFGVCPQLIAEYKALVGDASDNIKGIKGIGDKIARDLFASYGSVGGMRNAANVKEISKSKRKGRLYLDEDDFESDLLLTRIPRLADAGWYINDEERRMLVPQLTEYPQSNEFNARVNGEHIGKVLRTPQALVPVDFSGMTLEIPHKTSYTTWHDLDQTILTCNRCALRQHCGQHNPVLAQGYEDVEIMLVGSSPAERDLEAGEPFTGPEGKLVDGLLDACGLTRRSVYITYVCRCYAEDNRVPHLNEMMTCSPFLQSEVDLLRPRLVITFGNAAMSLFTPYLSHVTRHCGEIEKFRSGRINHDAWVSINLHPSSALRSQKGRSHFDYAVKTLKTFLEKRKP